MPSFVRNAVLGLVGASIGTSVHATVIYDGGASYSINTSINDNVEIANGSRVTVQSGGSVTGNNASFWGAVNVSSGALDLTGTARANAGTHQYAIRNNGSVRLADQTRVTGDVRGEWRAGLEMSGRSLLDGNVEYAGPIRMQDQAAILGDIRDNGTYSLDMRGGVVAGTVHMHGINGGYELNMHGGAILGGVNAWNSYGLDLHMNGGLIDNGLLVEGWADIDGEIRGGQINGGITVDTGGPYYVGTNDLVISGGQINANAADFLLTFSDTNTSPSQQFSSLAIWGGQFGYQEAGLGLFVDNLVNFDVHGRDLAYQNGWLTGWLLDGSWFNSALTFGSDYRGAFTIHNVPEPATWTLLLAPLLGAFAVRRRRA